MATYDNEKLYKTLQDLQVIEAVKLDQALAEAKSKNLPLGDLLLEKDLIADENLGKLIADLLGFPFINLRKTTIPKETLKIIPEIVAKKQQIINFKRDKQGLHLAMIDPSNLEMIDFIKKKVGDPVIPYLATERDIGDALELYRKGLEEEFSEIIKKSAVITKGVKEAETPIIKIVDTILSYADSNKASDIHIEPTEEESVVRFRIDGILHDVINLPHEIHPQIVIRVKVMAHLRTDDHQAAQDGKLVFKTEDEKLDIRVSIVPITEGEKVVMRLLSEKSRQFSLADLGFGERDLKKTERAYKKPYGMILATGPTGCGKTTTMYAVLKLLNKRRVNIMTIEDPVEYDIENVNQIQVNPKTGLTFAKGLRSIVRQDPDIILVGEVRDRETAGIAINSAMTGHLVLSTLHTNDAATAVPRLFDMAIEPFLVASSVNVVIAQRLVRKICTRCRTSMEIEIKEGIFGGLSADLLKKHFGDPPTRSPRPEASTVSSAEPLGTKAGQAKTIRVYKGKGCAVCHHTGYVGRVGLFEVMEIDDKLRAAIVSRQTAAALRKLAVEAGMTTMIEDGLEKVKQGITTVEEVVRVTKE